MSSSTDTSATTGNATQEAAVPSRPVLARERVITAAVTLAEGIDAAAVAAR